MTMLGLGASIDRTSRSPVPGTEPARHATRRSHRTPGSGMHPRYAWSLIALYSLAIAGVAVGLVGSAVAGVLIACSTVALTVGVRVNRPRLAWPFWGFVVAGVFWMVGAAAREATGSTGDLTASRSILPDVFALPGYAAYGIGLLGLIRARDGRNRGALTDALIVSVGGFLLAWELMVSRTLSDPDVYPLARAAIVIYPLLDCAFVALACRLAFSNGRRLVVHGMLLIAMFGLLAGDVAYVLDELGIVALGDRREIGFMVAAAMMGAAGLHPSVRLLHLRDQVAQRALPTTRAMLLAISLFLPAGLFIYGIDDPAVRSLPFQLGVLVLALVATVRLLDSVRTQNVATDRLTWQASHDGLTGLPNRTAITRLIDSRLEDPDQHLLIALFDLDNFKNINDAMGHAHGDQLLIEVARQLRSELPDDVMLGRVGGDEFVAVCDCADVDPDALALQITAVLSEPFDIAGFEALTTASIGITIARGERDADALLRDADTAMYRAKDAGRNTHVLFSDDMRAEVERRMRTERELRETLERGGEITAWFQSVNDITTGNVIGFEALARWVTPSRIVPPGEFIGVAEETGLITALGAEILDQACAAIADLRGRTGEQLFVTVNVSARQLVDDGIVRLVAETLERHQLPGNALCLEITESTMVNEKNVERLRALCRLGVWLAVDDFGTGYSSLSYLHMMPISKVKIDKSFVDDIADGDPSIMVAILSMAHSLGLTCVAEGVETRAQAHRLRQLGCDHAQGYLWSRPVPADQLIDLLGHSAIAV